MWVQASPIRRQGVRPPGAVWTSVFLPRVAVGASCVTAVLTSIALFPQPKAPEDWERQWLGDKWTWRGQMFKVRVGCATIACTPATRPHSNFMCTLSLR